MSWKTFATLAALAAASAPALALDDDFFGTYRLISTSRKSVETGAVTPGDPEQGYITYSRDGRMLVLIVREDRDKPKSLAGMSEAQRAAMFGSMISYGGTYEFDGKVMRHHIDISWNGAWTGVTQVRDVRKEGERLIYTTRPSVNSVNGDKNVTTLIWEKVK